MSEQLLKQQNCFVSTNGTFVEVVVFSAELNQGNLMIFSHCRVTSGWGSRKALHLPVIPLWLHNQLNLVLKISVIKYVLIVHRCVRWEMNFVCLSLEGRFWYRLWCFDCNTASLHQAMRSIVYVLLFLACWYAAIGAFQSLLLFQLLDGVPP